MNAELLKRKHEAEEEIRQILLDFYIETEKVFVLDGTAKKHYGKITKEFGDDILHMSTSTNMSIQIIE